MKQKQPWKILRVGGREFRIYREYDELVEHDVGIYPDFEANPEYTAEGRPFVTALQESCPHGYSGDERDPDPQDCSGCVWFYMESPTDAIGVCMCGELRKTD